MTLLLAQKKQIVEPMLHILQDMEKAVGAGDVESLLKLESGLADALAKAAAGNGVLGDEEMSQADAVELLELLREMRGLSDGLIGDISRQMDGVKSRLVALYRNREVTAGYERMKGLER